MLLWSIPFSKQWLTSPFPDTNLKSNNNKNNHRLFTWCIMAQLSGRDQPHSSKVSVASWFTAGENRGFTLPATPFGRQCEVYRHQLLSERLRFKAVCAGIHPWSLLLSSHSSYLTGEASVPNWWKAKVILILLWDLLLNCIIYKQRSFSIINGIENQNHQGKWYNSY